MLAFPSRTALVLAVLLAPGSLPAQSDAAGARDVLVAGSMPRRALEQAS